MVGVARFELTHEGVKVPCLTAWLHPIRPIWNGAFEEIRTPDPRLRRAMLYPTELQTHNIGAGDGNRTHAASLEGWNSTTELHPQRNLIYHKTINMSTINFWILKKILKNIIIKKQKYYFANIKMQSISNQC